MIALHHKELLVLSCKELLVDLVLVRVEGADDEVSFTYLISLVPDI